MKFINTIILSLFAVSTLSFAKEAKDDKMITCHPTKGEENNFRTFGLRLRETDKGIKMVSESVYADSPNSFEAKEYFNTLELNPNLNVSNSSIEIISGSQDHKVSAAFGVYKEEGSNVWTGRLQLWWPNQTSSYTTKVICFVGNENSNSSPVIP